MCIDYNEYTNSLYCVNVSNPIPMICDFIHCKYSVWYFVYWLVSYKTATIPYYGCIVRNAFCYSCTSTNNHVIPNNNWPYYIYACSQIHIITNYRPLAFIIIFISNGCQVFTVEVVANLFCVYDCTIGMGISEITANFHIIRNDKTISIAWKKNLLNLFLFVLWKNSVFKILVNMDYPY